MRAGIVAALMILGLLAADFTFADGQGLNSVAHHLNRLVHKRVVE